MKQGPALVRTAAAVAAAAAAAAAAAMVNPGTLDVLTGRIAREVYFDTKQLVGKDGKPAPVAAADEEKFYELEYCPVKVVQELPNEKVVVVRDDNDQVRRGARQDGMTDRPSDGPLRRRHRHRRWLASIDPCPLTYTPTGVPPLDGGPGDGQGRGQAGRARHPGPQRLLRDVAARDAPLPLPARRGVHQRGADPHLGEPVQVEHGPVLGGGHDPLPHARQGHEAAPGAAPLPGQCRSAHTSPCWFLFL